jgi:S-adenosylmethionine hydrolase
MPIITLTTDFGTADGYVGAMKGVLARQASACVVDLAHDIPPGDIAHAAWVIATSTTEFPAGSIHVVVVDPGVGGSRREVVLRADGLYYVGPDNGVFAYVAEADGKAHAIEDPRFRAERVSRTFHGRDVFATAAAAIASGLSPAVAGPAVELTGRLPWGRREREVGRVVHIDHFGNLITDLPEDEAGRSVAIAGTVLPLLATYESVPPGELLAYIGSAGTVEIAVRDGRADRRLGLERGALVLPVPGESAATGPYR